MPSSAPLQTANPKKALIGDKDLAKIQDAAQKAAAKAHAKENSLDAKKPENAEK